MSDGLKLCLKHKQEPNQSHFAECNCDYCKALSKEERLTAAITILLDDLSGRRLKSGTVRAVAIVRGVLDGAAIETPRVCSTCRREADSGECLSKVGVCVGKYLRFWEPKEVTKETAKGMAKGEVEA